MQQDIGLTFAASGAGEFCLSFVDVVQDRLSAADLVAAEVRKVPALGSRVYPVIQPQNSDYPAAVYYGFAEDRVQTFHGGRCVTDYIRLDIRAREYKETGSILKAVMVRLALTGRVNNDPPSIDDYDQSLKIYRKIVTLAILP